jgi:hypothetical protein
VIGDGVHLNVAARLLMDIQTSKSGRGLLREAAG